jgi:hypothetical protein
VVVVVGATAVEVDEIEADAEPAASHSLSNPYGTGVAVLGAATVSTPDTIEIA